MTRGFNRNGKACQFFVLKTSAPVGHASTHFFAAILRPSAIECSKGTATLTSKPRPIKVKPSDSPA